jgi:hypothetical protein
MQPNYCRFGPILTMGGHLFRGEERINLPFIQLRNQNLAFPGGWACAGTLLS